METAGIVSTRADQRTENRLTESIHILGRRPAVAATATLRFSPRAGRTTVGQQAAVRARTRCVASRSRA